MSRKFISFLGNGFYQPCIYTNDAGLKSRPTRFVQTALFEMLQHEGENIDEFYLFVTPEAKMDNYLDRYNEKGEFVYDGLQKVWTNYFSNTGIKPKLINISSDQGEADQWRLFEQIFSIVEPGDELYFDITHSFRSIPVMSLIIANFAKVINQAKINRLLYGNFEALFKVGRPADIPLESRLAPIVDITSMLELFDWTTSVKTFIDTGNPEQIDQLATEKIKENNQDENLRTIKRLTRSLNRLNKIMETSRGIEVHKTVPHVKENIKAVKQISDHVLPQLSKLMNEIEHKVDMLSTERKRNMWGSIKWCADHGLLQQALTLLREYMISVLYDQLDEEGLIPDNLSQGDQRDIREDISYIIHVYFNPEKKFSVGDYKDSHLFVKPIQQRIAEKEKAYQQFDTIINYRNNMNHAEKAQDKLPYQKIESRIHEIIKAIKPIFFEA